MLTETSNEKYIGYDGYSSEVIPLTEDILSALKHLVKGRENSSSKGAKNFADEV